ncbi:MAG TPA: VOC family protein [Candidatus Acidoferrales bacterium]|nr:VOC family protein [Candidatus Acidoferrales bacterium]
MLDHIGLAVADVAKSKSFFVAALAPLGYQIVMDFGEAIGLGAGGKPDFWIAKGKTADATHVAFVAPNRATVAAFHKAALAAGGRDNGAPGLRTQYHPNYYGAFVYDPDGNNIEAVCHEPE